MGDHQHGEAPAVLEALEHPQQVGLARGVQHGGGLVGDEQGGLHGQGPGHRHPLPLSAGQGVDGAAEKAVAGEEAHVLQGPRRRVLPEVAGEAHGLLHRRPDGHPGVEGGLAVLEHHLHPAQLPVEVGEAGRLPLKRHRAAPLQGEQARQGAGQGGLARAGAAHQGDDLPAVQGQVDVRQHLLSPEGLAQVPAGEQGEDAAPVAGELPPVGQPFQLRRAGGARRQALGAPAVEGAAVGLPGVGHGGGPDAPHVPHRVQAHRRLEQAPGIGVAGVVQDGPGVPGLLHVAVVEHHHPRRQVGGQLEIVGDDEEGGAQLAVQVPDQRRDPPAGGQIQGPGGLVQQHQGRVEGQGAGQQELLHHAAGQLPGVAGQIPLLQAHQGHQLPRPPGQGLPPVRPAQHLPQVLRQGEGGVEPLRRGLEGEGELFHPQGLPVALLHAQQLPAVEEHLAADLGHGVGQAGDGPGQGGLAAARLPHQGQDLPPVQGEAHRVEGELRKGDRQILYFQEHG